MDDKISRQEIFKSSILLNSKYFCTAMPMGVPPRHIPTHYTNTNRPVLSDFPWQFR
jgi:hypothetical protein